MRIKQFSVFMESERVFHGMDLFGLEAYYSAVEDKPDWIPGNVREWELVSKQISRLSAVYMEMTGKNATYKPWMSNVEKKVLDKDPYKKSILEILDNVRHDTRRTFAEYGVSIPHVRYMLDTCEYTVIKLYYVKKINDEAKTINPTLPILTTEDINAIIIKMKTRYSVREVEMEDSFIGRYIIDMRKKFDNINILTAPSKIYEIVDTYVTTVLCFNGAFAIDPIYSNHGFDQLSMKIHNNASLEKVLSDRLK